MRALTHRDDRVTQDAQVRPRALSFDEVGSVALAGVDADYVALADFDREESATVAPESELVTVA